MNRRIKLLTQCLFCLVLSASVGWAFAQNPMMPDAPVQENENSTQSDTEEEAGSESCQGEDCPQEGKAPAAADMDVAEMIGVDEWTEQWGQNLSGWLEQYGLSASLVGKSIASVTVVLFFVILGFVFKKLLHRLFRKLHSLSNRFHLHRGRLHFYQRALHIFVRVMLLCLTLLALLVVWDDMQDGLKFSQQITGFFHVAISTAVTFIVAVVVFELVAAVLERYLRKWEESGSSRVNTLLPIVRNVVYGTMFVIFGITFISELGIDVMPLLAGAGVVGFAVGFGAQTLVKDLITGFIIILEDLIQVGDVATLGGKSGLVERITIRKVQLRDLSGTVFTVPFSEISIVENLTKDFSYYLMNVGIAYRENTDEVVEILRQICDDLMREDEFKDNILEPIEILGVDGFADSAVIIKARIKTRPIKQWMVGREFNRRMKYAFDEHNIEIPFPHRTLYFGQNKDGSSPAARVLMDANTPAANDGDADRGAQSTQQDPEPGGNTSSTANEDNSQD